MYCRECSSPLPRLTGALVGPSLVMVVDDGDGMTCTLKRKSSLQSAEVVLGHYVCRQSDEAW